MQVALEILKPYKKKSYQQYHTQTDLNWPSEILEYHKNQEQITKNIEGADDQEYPPRRNFKS